MLAHTEVLGDLTTLRACLRERDGAHRQLLHLTLARPLADIGFDWLVVLAATAAVVGFGAWAVPVSVVVIANRQRALGNILHDAGHRNLSRDRRVNDAIAGLLVAPLVFASLRCYRESHFQHHLCLGDPLGDPDFLAPAAVTPRHWLATYWRQMATWRSWWGSFAGHLGATGVSVASRAWIVVWWAALLASMASLAGAPFTLAFVALWLLARATAFHLITMLREMCDHHGLLPGGVFSFTRDMACGGVWRRLIHPRNNGYHLTHHLLPAVPYYRLPQAHRLFLSVPAVAARARVCRTYFAGTDAVIRDWQRTAS